MMNEFCLRSHQKEHKEMPSLLRNSYPKDGWCQGSNHHPRCSLTVPQSLFYIPDGQNISLCTGK